MGIEYADKLTKPASDQIMYDALKGAWAELTPSPLSDLPTHEALCVLLAQWAHETGHGAHMHCYNPGNIKCPPSSNHDYCYFACYETYRSASEAEQLVKDEQDRVAKTKGSKPLIVFKHDRNKQPGFTRVWFLPKRAECRFCAYPTLEDGCVDYLMQLHGRFEAAWPAIIAGKPADFVDALADEGYFTDDVETYKKDLTRLFNHYRRKYKPVVHADIFVGHPVLSFVRDPLGLFRPLPPLYRSGSSLYPSFPGGTSATRPPTLGFGVQTLKPGPP